MTAQQVVNALLRLTGLILSWPVAIALIVYLLRHPLRRAVAGLAERITHIEAPGGLKIDLAEVSVRALRETVSDASKEFADPTELSDYVQRQLDKVVEVGADLGEPVDLTGRTILWVDDRPANNSYESHLLVELGARIKNVVSTAEALADLRRSHFDLVISDMYRIEGGREEPRAGRDLAVEMERQGWTTPILFYSEQTPSTQGLRRVVGFECEPGKLIASVIRVLTGERR